MSKQRKPRIKKFNGPLRQIENDVASSSSQDGSEEATEDKFERELVWCVEQLQLGLEKQKPDSRQALEAIKVLRILQSDKTPLVKKRQAMRNTFGDYRQKMKAEEKRMASKMRRLEVTSGDAGKSVFYRKSSQVQTTPQASITGLNDADCMTEGLKSIDLSEGSINGIDQSEHRDDLKIIFNKTEEEFKFNFKISSSNTHEDGVSVKENHSANNELCTTVGGNENSINCVSGKESECNLKTSSTQRSDKTTEAERIVSKAAISCSVSDGAQYKDHCEDTVPDVTSFVGKSVHNYFVGHDKSGSDFKFNFSAS